MVVILTGFLLCGCAHGPYAPQYYGPGAVSYEQTERIVFVDRALVSKIRVAAISGLFEPDAGSRFLDLDLT